MMAALGCIQTHIEVPICLSSQLENWATAGHTAKANNAQVAPYPGIVTAFRAVSDVVVQCRRSREINCREI